MCYIDQVKVKDSRPRNSSLELRKCFSIELSSHRAQLNLIINNVRALCLRNLISIRYNVVGRVSGIKHSARMRIKIR